MATLARIAQLIVAFVLLNVWLFRHGKATDYRGGTAKTLKEEFAVYGLPVWAWLVVGGLKVSCGLLLIAGLFFPGFVLYPAAVIAGLMVGAIAMHVKVQDPVKKSLPAAVVLALSAVIILAHLPR